MTTEDTNIEDLTMDDIKADITVLANLRKARLDDPSRSFMTEVAGIRSRHGTDAYVRNFLIAAIRNGIQL